MDRAQMLPRSLPVSVSVVWPTNLRASVTIIAPAHFRAEAETLVETDDQSERNLFRVRAGVVGAVRTAVVSARVRIASAVVESIIRPVALKLPVGAVQKRYVWAAKRPSALVTILLPRSVIPGITMWI